MTSLARPRAITTAALVLVACTSCVTLGAGVPLSRAAAHATTLHTLRVDGGTRSFYLHLPVGFSHAHRYPLLILLHGHHNTGASVLHQTKMEAAADRYGFIVAAPNGTGRFSGVALAWNAGTCCGWAQAHHVDDVGFLARLVDTLAAVLPVDRSRVTIAGFSAGGMLALDVACNRPTLATAIVNVQGTMPDTACAAPHPVSVLLVAGDDDDDMREEHAENRRHNAHPFAFSATATLRFWARRDGCAPSIPSRETPTLTEYDATGCADATEVKLVTVHDHPHAWPGGHRTWWFAPKPSHAVDATHLIVDFVAALAPSHREGPPG